MEIEDIDMESAQGAENAEMFQDDANLSLRSEEVREILGRPPRRIVRWGITVIFVVVAGLFIGSCFIKYPDVLQAPVTVTTEHLPAGVAARSSGKIDTLFVTEGEIVTEGAPIAVLENPARWQDVQWLRRHISEASRDTLLQLGGIQSAYFAYLKAREDYDYFIRTDYHRQKAKAVGKEIAAGRLLLRNSERQRNTQRQQLEIAHTLFAMDSGLHAKGLTSKSEYESSRSRYLQQQQEFESACAACDNRRVSLLQLEQSLFDLEQQRNDQENSLNLALEGARDGLLAEMEAWEQTYLLKAPCEGRVAFTTYWQRNQNVTAGEVVATVVPERQARIIGKILLPPQGAGKVKVGQTANIKFDGYPYMEYGMVKVAIRHISLVPVQLPEGGRAFLLEVDFPQRLETTYHKQLDFTQEMTGTAEVITEDLRLIDRFLNPIRAVIFR